MERPETSNQEYFTNEIIEIKDDSSNIVLSDQNQNFETFSIEMTSTEAPVEEKPPAKETPTAEQTIAEEVKDSAFNELATSIWKATVDNAVRIQSYVTRIHGGILKPVRWGIDVDDDLVVRILLGAALIGALKKSDFSEGFNIVISIVRIAAAIFYPFVYLSVIFCEELFWSNLQSSQPLENQQMHGGLTYPQDAVAADTRSHAQSPPQGPSGPRIYLPPLA